MVLLHNTIIRSTQAAPSKVHTSLHPIKMRFFLFAALCVPSVFASAARVGSLIHRSSDGGNTNNNNNYSLTSCRNSLDSVNSPTVKALVNDYAQLIGNFTEALGDAFLADKGFTDTSASINVLSGLPLDAVTFDSKAAFIASQETQPAIPLVISDISAVSCNTVVVRWTQTFGADPQPVAGISILDFVCEEGTWKLQTIYAEFNSLVYFENIGGTVTPPSSSS